MTPRLLQLKDAYRYIGVNRDYFNRLVRPRVLEIRKGESVLIDRHDLDRLIEQWKDETRQKHADDARSL